LAESDSSPNSSEALGDIQESHEASDDDSKKESLYELYDNDEDEDYYYDNLKDHCNDEAAGGVLLGIRQASLENIGNACYLNYLLRVLGSSKWLFSLLCTFYIRDVWPQREILRNFHSRTS
jgi:uncharacterized UBP type Zn finger protein